MGEEALDFKFLPAGGQFHLRASDEALTPYGGLVAWDHFLERCGVITELAADFGLQAPQLQFPDKMKVTPRADGSARRLHSDFPSNNWIRMTGG